MSADVPVAIVGGGPVGMALAIDLAQREVPTIVVERHLEPQAVPKGQNLTQRTAEHFRRWNIEDEIRAARTHTGGQAPVGLVVHGELTGEHYYPWLQRDLVSKYYATTNERLPQYATERVLRERLRAFPQAQVRYGWTAEGVHQGEDGAEIEAVSRAGARDLIRAQWVVGCDGGRSVVRRSAGITQTATDHDRLMVLVVFRSPEFDRIMANRPHASFLTVLHPDLEGYWQFFGRVDASETWFFHAPVDPQSTAESIDLGAVLGRAVGQRFAFEVEYLGFWDLRFALADTYVSGRLLIAGDAAHSHPPYGGYGINSGFEDAVNLGWKLSAVVQGWAGPDLLSSYDAERRPVFASTRDDFIDRSIQVDRSFLAAYDPQKDPVAFLQAWRERQRDAEREVQRFAPNYDGSPIVLGSAGHTPSAVGDHEFRARAGYHLAPGTTRDGEAVFDLLGAGFTLLVADGADATEFVAAAGDLGIPFDVLAISEQSRLAYEAEMILVRPDQFVAWAGAPRTESARSVLRTAVGHGRRDPVGTSGSSAAGSAQT